MTIDDNEALYTEEELKAMFPDSIAIEFYHQPPERPRVISITVPWRKANDPSHAQS